MEVFNSGRARVRWEKDVFQGSRAEGKVSAARLALISWAVCFEGGSQYRSLTFPCSWREKEAFLAQGRGLKMEWRALETLG